MFSFQKYDHNGLFQEPSSVNLIDGVDSITSSASKDAKKLAAACKSHKEAERRRRQRINAHLSTLRTLLPSTTKTDKATLLAEVVHHVKELRKQAADVAPRDGHGSEPDPWPFPGESDEVTLSYFGGEASLIKATLCCEDRPGLNRDLARAIRLVQAKAVRAEMMTVGGRTKSAVVLELADGGGEEKVADLRRVLKAVVENRAMGTGLAHIFPKSKRARVCNSVEDGGGDEFFLSNYQQRKDVI